MDRQVPILRHGETLIASVPEEASDGAILALQFNILEQISRKDTRYVVVDVSMVDVLDSFGTRTLTEIAAAVRLKGARMAIVGIQPEVAISMVLLGLGLETVPTAANLDTGMALLRRSA